MPPGTRSLDNYQLLKQIATSKSCQIWEVASAGAATHECMKLLLKDAFANAAQVKALKHEGKVIQLLDHPNIVKLRSMNFTKTHGYLILELFRFPMVKSHLITDPAFVQSRIHELMESVCQALDHVHQQGWLHKDIKPDNILMSHAGDVRLIDFSVAEQFGGSGLAKLFRGKSKNVQGTRTYIAPETVRRQTLTPQTDVYSLGATLFELLTGRAPFQGSSPDDLLAKHVGEKPPRASQFNENLTPETDRFLSNMLAKKPSDRPRSMKAVANEFRDINVFKRPVEWTPPAEGTTDDSDTSNARPSSRSN